MSKLRSHLVTQFQVRAMYLSETTLASGEGSVAIATLRSGMAATTAQIVALAEREVAK